MEYIIIIIKKDMKESIKNLKEKDMEYIIIIMEIDMKESIKMIYLMVMVFFIFKIKNYIHN